MHNTAEARITDEAVFKHNQELEAALPGLVDKLKQLSATLSDDERVVFKEIIESAARHTQLIQAHDQGSVDIVYAKPVQVHSTVGMKEEYLQLPAKLGLS